MIPKVHPKGTSFKGAAAYLLHDVDRAKTSERVAWVETRNLPIDERLDALKRGEIAWRLMAATAMDQARIKERAWQQEQDELPEELRQPYRERGGRKSNVHALHITLSWAEHEADGVTREEMLKAAEGALAALGEEPGKKGGRTRADGTKAGHRTATRRQFADEHQALIVCHDDTEHPHVHILLNRVHPEHGVMLPTSKDQLLLSRWAQRYEEERGEILCEQRRINNLRRDQGDHWSQGSKNKSRHLYELEAANDNEDLAAEVRAEQRTRDHELAKKSRNIRKRNKDLRLALDNRVVEKRKQIRREADAKLKASRKSVRDAFERRFTELHHQHAADRQAFSLKEGTYSGRVKNALRVIDWKGLLTTGRRSSALREAFGVLAGGENKRTEAMRRRQQAEMVALEKEQAAALKEAEAPIRDLERAHRKLAQGWQLVKRQEVEIRIAEREAALREEWKVRRAERQQAWAAVPSLEKGRKRPLGARGEQTTTPDREIKRAEKDAFLADLRKRRDRGRGCDDDRER